MLQDEEKRHAPRAEGNIKQECSRVLTEGRQEISSNGVSLAAGQPKSRRLAHPGGFESQVTQEVRPQEHTRRSKMRRTSDGSLSSPTPGSTDAKIGVEQQASSSKHHEISGLEGLLRPVPHDAGPSMSAAEGKERLGGRRPSPLSFFTFCPPEMRDRLTDQVMCPRPGGQNRHKLLFSLRQPYSRPWWPCCPTRALHM